MEDGLHAVCTNMQPDRVTRSRHWIIAGLCALHVLLAVVLRAYFIVVCRILCGPRERLYR
jgi:hypothetical protein